MSDSMRSLAAFGVASFLKENCTIFYSSDFRSRSVGRLSDLMAAKLREVNADELKIRTLLLYGLYESYAAQGKPLEAMTEVPPVQIEIGVDDIYVAIGITFHAREGGPVSFNGMQNRVMSGGFQTRFDELLGFARQHCTQIVVRYEKKEHRVEVVALLHRSDADKRDPIEVLEVNSQDAPLLEVGQYVEMGDLNYIDLTKEAAAPSPSVKIDETIVAGETPETAADAERRFASDPAPGEEAVQVVAGSDPTDGAESAALIEKYERELGALQERLRAIEAENREIREQAMTRQFTGEKPETETVRKVAGEKPAAAADDWGLGFLKQMWPFKSEEAVQTVKGGATEEELAAKEFSAVSERDLHPEEEKVVVKGAAIEAADDTPIVFSAGDEDALSDVEKNTEQALDRIREMASNRNPTPKAQKILDSMNEGGDAAKGKKWVEGLMLEIVAEKAKLNDLTKALSKQVRSRELEFKNRERGLTMELSKRDEAIRQKDQLLERKTDQLAQVNMALERQKSIGTSDGEQQLKIKLTNAQKLASMKEEENKTLITKVRDLENRLIIAQAKSSRPAQDPAAAAKVATAEKKLDEYKRINQRLMDQLNQSRDKGENQEVADLRRKVEQMDRQLNDSKKNLEKQQFRMRELQESERKLQADLQRSLDENRKLRASGNRGSDAA